MHWIVLIRDSDLRCFDWGIQISLKCHEGIVIFIFAVDFLGVTSYNKL